MDVKILAKLSKWMCSTDLEELTWESGENKISLKTNNLPVETNIPASAVQPVLAPAIGIYHSAMLGSSNTFKEGQNIEKGQDLGWIETGKNREPILASCSGTLKISAAKDGQPTEYGQPLFFIEP